MQTKFLLDKLLQPDNFLRSNSQAGPYIGQPVAASGNTGTLRCISSGDENDEISNFSYNGEATANGSQTTIVDSKLAIYGNDFFIGGTVTLTSGVSNGESRSITDFVSNSGTITWATDTISTSSGDSYTLTLDYSNRGFLVELVDGGDIGNACFRWSHDNGSNYFGRTNPDNSNWVGGTTICTDYSGFYYDNAPTSPYVLSYSPPVLQAINGNLLVPYCRDASSQVVVDISSDNGLTWQTTNVPSGILSSLSDVCDGVVLNSGRIVLIGHFSYNNYSYNLLYSDDNGLTWSIRPMTRTAGSITQIVKIEELSNGNLIGVYEHTSNIHCIISSDEGATWSDIINIVNTSGNQIDGDIIQLNNGDIACVYYTDDVDPGTTYAIRCIISNDNGTSWNSGSSVTVASGDHNLKYPSLAMDINGDLYCAYSEFYATEGGSSIVIQRSVDNGITWGTSRTIAGNSGHTLWMPKLSSINGHELVCSYIDDVAGTTSLVFCRKGIPSSAGSSIPCAINTIKHKLINDVAIQWYGSNGSVSDSWTFQPKHWYAAENIVADNPNKVWRSAIDSITCELVIDMGANEMLLADSVALFNCNISSCSIEMHSSDSWTSPNISESVSFVEQSGALNYVYGNYIGDTGNSKFDKYKDHELGDGKHYITVTSGSSDGASFLIADNIDTYVALDTTEAHGIAGADTIKLYGSKMYQVFDSGTTFYRYMRIYIPAHKTPQGYYQIGCMILGKTTTFNNTFSDSRYNRNTDLNVNIMRSLSGNMLSTKQGDDKKKFTVNWDASFDSRKEVFAAVRYSKGCNIAFIPDWFVPVGGSKSSTTDVYLVKQTGTIRENFRYKDRWDLSIDLEENV